MYLSYDRGHPDAMCSQLGVLQLACAALEALDHKGNHHRDKMYATEKVKDDDHVCDILMF